MTTLAAVSSVRVVERKSSAVVLSVGVHDPAPRVVAEVRECENGSEVVVRLDGANASTSRKKGMVMALVWLFAAAKSPSSPMGMLSLFCGSVFLVLLIIQGVYAARNRQSDFKAIAQAIDVALREFKPGEEGAVYRVGAGGGPVGEVRVQLDDGLGIFRSRARRSR